jgi:hypothetical protein
MLNLTMLNAAKVRETTCGYAKGVDGIDTTQPATEPSETAAA